MLVSELGRLRLQTAAENLEDQVYRMRASGLAGWGRLECGWACNLSLAHVYGCADVAYQCGVRVRARTRAPRVLVQESGPGIPAGVLTISGQGRSKGRRSAFETRRRPFSQRTHTRAPSLAGISRAEENVPRAERFRLARVSWPRYPSHDLFPAMACKLLRRIENCRTCNGQVEREGKSLLAMATALVMVR